MLFWEEKEILVLLLSYNILPKILMHISNISFLNHYIQAGIILMKNTDCKTDKAMWLHQEHLLVLQAPSLYVLILDFLSKYYLIDKCMGTHHVCYNPICLFEILTIYITRKTYTGRNEIQNAGTIERALVYKVVVRTGYWTKTCSCIFFWLKIWQYFSSQPTLGSYMPLNLSVLSSPPQIYLPNYLSEHSLACF